MTILITGVSGFVGQMLKCKLSENNISYRGVLRHFQSMPNSEGFIEIGSIEGNTDWCAALEGIDVVIHLAARAHIMKDEARDPLEEYRSVNTLGTLNLAKQAAHAGVKRFVFISSVKANGETTSRGDSFNEQTPLAPVDFYGISKKEAEDGLKTIASSTGMEVVIIRPVLVYGPGVKANFYSMMKWVKSGIPLPLGMIKAKRSMVSLDNLVDFIITCSKHPKAANETFLVSDDMDLSIPEILRKLAEHIGVKLRLVPVPTILLKFAALILGKKALAQRLCSPLQVDISKAKELLDWTPPVTVDEALQKTVKAFLEENK